MGAQHPGPVDELALFAAYRFQFVAERDTGLHWWAVSPTGHEETDIATGELYATVALAVAKECDFAFLIAVVLRDMVRSGRFTGLEAGFLGTIASAAKAGAMH
jgi:hypothetical protein